MLHILNIIYIFAEIIICFKIFKMNNKKVKKIVTTTTTVTEEIIKTNGKTHIVCILDRSGSMNNIISDSIGGFNNFIKKQKELGDDAALTLALFDDKYDLIYDEVNICDVKDITLNEWYPRGWTRLYDAIGKTINSLKSKENKSDSFYEKTLICIVTDGYENDSKEYNSESIKKMISESEKNGWEFIYLGANQDAFNEGFKFGMNTSNTYTYQANSFGVGNAFDNINYYTTSYRTTGNGAFIGIDDSNIATGTSISAYNNTGDASITINHNTETTKTTNKQQLND